MASLAVRMCLLALVACVAGCSWPRREESIQTHASLCEIILQLRRDIRNSSVRPGQQAVGLPLSEATVILKLGLVREVSGDFKVTAAVPVASLGVSGSESKSIENTITLVYKRIDGKDGTDVGTLGLPPGELASIPADQRQKVVRDALAAADADDQRACNR
ncbi:trypco2 family protein [Variovorax soli]|uniref:Trypsin-co-occurring domain-containing protein n=1 Tax=Variovorax soli TaxID=376815 RepID=A0ABU1NK57_9BURK|nr:trypco2 family protein [Variovorax soli]MDR6538855.1 hypothetical protein [Variovorax soli]